MYCIDCFQVPVREGVAIREALDKAMKTRNLSPSHCTIFTEHPRMLIDWDMDTGQLDGKEVLVLRILGVLQ